MVDVGVIFSFFVAVRSTRIYREPTFPLILFPSRTYVLISNSSSITLRISTIYLLLAPFISHFLNCDR